MEKVGERMADISTEELERIEREYHSGSDNIKPIQEFSKPEDLYDELIASIRKYHPSTDITLIEKAYHVAFEAHKGQVRKSGEAYIIHPLCVAIILAELELDKETIAAGLLHDVLEDTVMTEEQMREEFGDEVLLLVDGVTKLQHLHLTDNIKNPKDKNADRLEMQAENLRKMFLAMAKDIRVIMIKLADRLHNMRTLKYQSKEAQQRIARETQEIYCPIAQRLGISKIKIELEDLSLKYLEPEAYYDLVEKVALRKNVRDAYVQGLVADVRREIEEAGIKAEISGRAKHFFSKSDCQGKLCRQKAITWCIKKLTARQFVQKTSLKKLLAVLFFNPVLILRGRLSAALPRCQFVSFVFYLFSAFQAACAYGSRHRHNIWQSHPCEPP